MPGKITAPAPISISSVAFALPKTTIIKPFTTHSNLSNGRLISHHHSLRNPTPLNPTSLARLNSSVMTKTGHRLNPVSTTALSAHKDMPNGGHALDSDGVIHMNLAAREARGKPIGPEHLLIVFLERLNLSVLQNIGITANAVRDAIGTDIKAPPRPLLPKDRVTLSNSGIGRLTFSEDLHRLLSSIQHESGEIPISFDTLVKGLLSHLSNDPTLRMQNLLVEVIDKHNIDKHNIIDQEIDTLMKKDSINNINNSINTDLENNTLNTKNAFEDDFAQYFDSLDSLDDQDDDSLKPYNPSEAVNKWYKSQTLLPTTPTLDKLGNDLTLRAAKGKISFAFGREQETLMLSLALQYFKKGSAIIVGPPGCGKTALVEGLAKSIVEGKIESLEGYRLVSVSVGSLLAGTQYRGMLEKNVQEIIKEAQDQKIIVFIDEIHGVIGGGKTSENTGDIGNLIKAAQGVKWIGATTSSEYTRIFKKDEALNRRFERIDLTAPNRETLQVILDGIKPDLEKHYNITYSNAALQSVINYASRYLPGYSPDKELTALDRAGAWAKHNNATEVDAHQIALSIEHHTRIPLTGILSDTDAHLPGREIVNNIIKDLRQYVIGQDKAVEAVASAIFQSRTGVNADKPFVLVFAGPTGTGKTELVKAISKVDGRHIIEINLETVQQISTLKGAEPGYVGHGEEGTLTGPQKLNPYSVVLMDEMEKTTNEVIRALLGLMDNGKMTDSSGEEVSFKNSIIVFTTNYGAHDNLNKKSMGFDLGILDDDNSSAAAPDSPNAESIKKRLGEKLGPEVVGRFNDLIIFNALEPEELLQISRLVLNSVSKDIEQSKNIKIEYGNTLIEAIADQGYDPKSGARAIRNICNNLVRDAIGDAVTRWPELNSFETEDHIEIDLVKETKGMKAIDAMHGGALLLIFKGEQLFIPISQDLRHIQH